MPNEDYKRIWKYVDTKMSSHAACKFIVGILYIAAKESCEAELGRSIIEAIEDNKPLNITDFQNRFKSEKIEHPNIEVNQHSLIQYNHLIPQAQEVFCHA